MAVGRRSLILLTTGLLEKPSIRVKVASIDRAMMFGGFSTDRPVEVMCVFSTVCSGLKVGKRPPSNNNRKWSLVIYAKVARPCEMGIEPLQTRHERIRRYEAIFMHRMNSHARKWAEKPSRGKHCNFVGWNSKKRINNRLGLLLTFVRIRSIELSREV